MDAFVFFWVWFEGFQIVSCCNCVSQYLVGINVLMLVIVGYELLCTWTLPDEAGRYHVALGVLIFLNSGEVCSLYVAFDIILWPIFA
jgi:hypothetical protein